MADGVYDDRPNIEKWRIREFVLGGWCINATNGYVTETFYEWMLPPWRCFWDEKTKYLKLRQEAQRWMDAQDQKILQAQKKFEARDAVRHSKD